MTIHNAQSEATSFSELLDWCRDNPRLQRLCVLTWGLDSKYVPYDEQNDLRRRARELILDEMDGCTMWPDGRAFIPVRLDDAAQAYLLDWPVLGMDLNAAPAMLESAWWVLYLDNLAIHLYDEQRDVPFRDAMESGPLYHDNPSLRDRESNVHYLPDAFPVLLMKRVLTIAERLDSHSDEGIALDLSFIGENVYALDCGAADAAWMLPPVPLDSDRNAGDAVSALIELIRWKRDEALAVGWTNDRMCSLGEAFGLLSIDPPTQPTQKCEKKATKAEVEKEFAAEFLNDEGRDRLAAMSDRQLADHFKTWPTTIRSTNTYRKLQAFRGDAHRGRTIADPGQEYIADGDAPAAKVYQRTRARR